MQVRYRYRIEPSEVQRGLLARVFGCCRVVFNDAVRIRMDARDHGEEITPTEIQRRVITEAKRQEDRLWLCEVPSVALAQSVRDAQRAYSNFLASISRRRRGKRVGPPRFKSRKDSRQSFRLTRNGFTLRPDGKLFLAKIGDVRVRWSRPLPSPPSSVTVVREPDGHVYASFVVEVTPTPLPPVDREAGIDLGVARLATVVGSDGSRCHIANMKHLQAGQRKITRLEREKVRRAQGGRNRAKTARKLAVQHRKIARARHDYHHKQALHLVRDNQAIYVEDLNIAGMMKNRRLARAVQDAGLGQFVRLLEEKALRYGRTVMKVSRWLPSSKTCSHCGHVLSVLPLRVRVWTCSRCMRTHDRDLNAALNILAAGRAEREKACGARVRPSL